MNRIAIVTLFVSLGLSFSPSAHAAARKSPIKTTAAERAEAKRAHAVYVAWNSPKAVAERAAAKASTERFNAALRSTPAYVAAEMTMKVAAATPAGQILSRMVANSMSLGLYAVSPLGYGARPGLSAFLPLY